MDKVVSSLYQKVCIFVIKVWVQVMYMIFTVTLSSRLPSCHRLCVAFEIVSIYKMNKKRNTVWITGVWQYILVIPLSPSQCRKARLNLVGPLSSDWVGWAMQRATPILHRCSYSYADLRWISMTFWCCILIGTWSTSRLLVQLAWRVSDACIFVYLNRSQPSYQNLTLGMLRTEVMCRQTAFLVSPPSAYMYPLTGWPGFPFWQVVHAVRGC